MDNRVRLLGIPVDIASTSVAGEASIQYMAEECSKVVYFVNSETLLLLQNNKGIAEKNDIDANDPQAANTAILDGCDMVLPGNTSVNKGINDVLGQKRDPFFLESYFDTIFNYAIGNGSELFLIAGSKEHYDSVLDNIHEQWPYLTLSGAFMTEQDSSYEHIVNEINSIAPDVLIVALGETLQLELLRDYRKQINAGLMLFTGNILYHKAVSEAKLPESIEKLKMGNIYKWFMKGDSGKSWFNNIKMKLRLKRDKQD